MRANEYQVGGQHYKTRYEHWDLVIDVGLCYFTGQATKYVSRWRKKNGVEDLKKALHFVNKLAENASKVGCFAARPRPKTPLMRRTAVLQFAKENELGAVEEKLLLTLVEWNTPEDLYFARDAILYLIPDEEGATVENRP